MPYSCVQNVPSKSVCQRLGPQRQYLLRDRTYWNVSGTKDLLLKQPGTLLPSLPFLPCPEASSSAVRGYGCDAALPHLRLKNNRANQSWISIHYDKK